MDGRPEDVHGSQQAFPVIAESSSSPASLDVGKILVRKGGERGLQPITADRFSPSVGVENLTQLSLGSFVVAAQVLDLAIYFFAPKATSFMRPWLQRITFFRHRIAPSKQENSLMERPCAGLAGSSKGVWKGVCRPALAVSHWAMRDSNPLRFLREKRDFLIEAVQNSVQSVHETPRLTTGWPK